MQTVLKVWENPLFWAILWPALSALVTLAARKKTPEEWENWALRKPVLAFVVEFCRAYGLDVKKAAVVVGRFIQRRAGEVPDDVWEKLPVSPILKEALKNPETRRLLSEMLTEKERLPGQPQPREDA